MRKQWSIEEINAWYDAQPWLTGFNFYPSTTINQTEIWQEYDHARVFADIGKELSLAKSIGFNCLRTILPFELWQRCPEVFFRHLEEYLALCADFGIRVMPVLFDDCCVPRERYQPMVFGKQPDPEPGYFGGSSVTCFETTNSAGYTLIDDEGMDVQVENYIRQLMEHFRNDDRILVWNVWNEPGNSNRGSQSLPMMTKVFGWLRQYDASQPLAADLFSAGCDFPDEYLCKPRVETEIELAAVALSDIISYHYYGDYLHMRQFIQKLKEYQRPLLCTEWLHRPMRSFIQTHLPLLKRERVGSFMFGFVNGKSQFNEVWEYLKERKDMDTTLWMHDIFHSNFVPYDQEEIDVIKQCNLEG